MRFKINIEGDCLEDLDSTERFCRGDELYITHRFSQIKERGRLHSFEEIGNNNFRVEFLTDNGIFPLNNLNIIKLEHVSTGGRKKSGKKGKKTMKKGGAKKKKSTKKSPKKSTKKSTKKKLMKKGGAKKKRTTKKSTKKSTKKRVVKRKTTKKH